MIKAAFVVFGVCLLLNSSATAQESSPVDFNGDGEVNFADFIAFARGFGKTDQDADFDARLDLNNNGEVDFQDFVLFARQFGVSTPSEDADKEPFDPARIYVADQLSDRVFVLDGESNFYDPGLSVALKQPRSVIYSYLNRRFYVAGIDSFYALTESSEIDYRLPLLDSPELPSSPPRSRGGFRMALSPDQRLVYITEDEAVQVEVIDLKNAESVALIPLSLQPSGIAISPDGEAIYVGHSQYPWISVINGPGQTLEDSIRLEGWGNGRVAVSAKSERIYTATTLRGDEPSVHIVAIDPATKAVTNNLEVAADSTTFVEEMKSSKDGRKLYVTVVREFLAPLEPFGRAFESYFLTIDSETLKTTSEISIKGIAGSFGVSRDGKVAYVALLDFLTQSFQLNLLDLENDLNLGTIPVSFFTPFNINVYGGKAAFGRTAVPEITIF